MIAWREKFVAFTIHFLLTLVLAACAAGLIFFVWFPEPFDNMVGGTQLFLLVVGCDLALGPLISLVIFNSKKSRKELVTDYTVVGVMQLAALIYGVWTVSNARPAFVVFTRDRLEVVAANDLDAKDLAAARPPYNSLPKWGPQFVAAGHAKSRKEETELLFSAVAGGKDLQQLPQYYEAYDSARAEIQQHALPLNALYSKHPEAKSLVERQRLPTATTLHWLPVKHHRGFWTALIDPKTARPVGYVNLDPY